MERAPLPPALTSAPALPEEQSRSMGETARMLTAIALIAAVGVGGALTTSETPEREAGTIDDASVAALSAAHYKPITDFYFRRNRKDVLDTATAEVSVDSGHSMDIITPDRDSLKAYNSYFDNLPASVTRPKLTEVIHIRDRNTFSGEMKEHPRKYPFSVFNATEHPIDVAYLDYALRSVRYWLNETAADKGGVIIDRHTLIKVKPRDIPHAMVMVNGRKAYDAGDGSADSRGVTTYTPGHLTKSFILNDGPLHNPFAHETIATEACQGMANVYGEKTVPGGTMAERHMENVVRSFNHTATPQNIHDLASQESVCNMLGNVIAAAYQGGRQAVEKLTARTATTGLFAPTPWLDYSLAGPETPRFLWLAGHIPGEWNELIAARNDHSPTVNYYRHHKVL